MTDSLPIVQACNSSDVLIGDSFRIEKLFLNRRKEIILGISRDNKVFIKIELIKNPRKSGDILSEAEVIRELNAKGCVSCPKLLMVGNISASNLLDNLTGEAHKLVEALGDTQLNWMAQEYIASTDSAPLPDLIFSLLEQKKLGIYQGDIKPDNIRYGTDGVCYLVDYDQAEILRPEISGLSFFEFMEWCDQREKQKYGFHTWRRHFSGLEVEEHFRPLFRGDSFNLATTTLYRRQATTNTPNGVYHTLAFKDVFADGVRTLDDRRPILDSITFSQGEKLLDVGCNAGLLSMYLSGRGCVVTGGEMDASIVMAARMINNILHNTINFVHYDLDMHEVPGSFDTIMLFSVIHHSKNLERNCQKIALACKRIIIECRLKEDGKRPQETQSGEIVWETSSEWNFRSIDDLCKGLENLFPGFLFSKNYGAVDKSRYVLELTKSDTENV